MFIVVMISLMILVNVVLLNDLLFCRNFSRFRFVRLYEELLRFMYFEYGLDVVMWLVLGLVC